MAAYCGYLLWLLDIATFFGCALLTTYQVRGQRDAEARLVAERRRAEQAGLYLYILVTTCTYQSLRIAHN